MVKKQAISVWFAEGFRIPGWILVRKELGLEAKVLYGLLLEEAEIWRGQQEGEEAEKPPVFKPDALIKLLEWEPVVFRDAIAELFNHKLLSLGHMPDDKEGTHRYEFEPHEWQRKCFYEVDVREDDNRAELT